MMEDISLLRKLERVTAPPDFERRVMARLTQRRTALPRVRKVQVFRYSLAGAAAALLVCFLALNVFVGKKNGPARMTERNAKGALNSAETIPITEGIDYRSEVRNSSYDPQTVYILEQVSNVSNKYIKY